MCEPIISICICTFKRPNLLNRLLRELPRQQTKGLFKYSIVVADNDRNQSARDVVTRFAAMTSVPVTYCVEPEQNIALARNRVLEHANGELIAFIDDDEFPTEWWLYNLFTTRSAYDVAGVLGPVRPYFEQEPPEWVVKGKFFNRPTHDTGYRLFWSETRTGNVLFIKEILEGISNPFMPGFGTGSEDVDFFRRMMGMGHNFVWCNEAIVYEVVPPERCTRSYLVRLALLRGGNSAKHPVNRLQNAAKSLCALPVYTIALPIFAIYGQHMFMKYLVKLFDHGSRLVAFLGWNIIKKRMI